MNIPQIGLYGTAIIVVLCLTAFLVKEEKRRLVGNILLIVLTVFSGTFILTAVTGTGRLVKGNAPVNADTAEMQLRLMSCLTWVEKTTDKNIPSSVRTKWSVKDIEKKDEQRHQAFDRAEKALRETYKQNPKNTGALAKLAVVLMTDDRDRRFATLEVADQLMRLQGTEAGAAEFRIFGSTVHEIAKSGHSNVGDAAWMESSDSKGKGAERPTALAEKSAESERSVDKPKSLVKPIAASPQKAASKTASPEKSAKNNMLGGDEIASGPAKSQDTLRIWAASDEVVKKLSANITQLLPAGWYRNNALLVFYSTAGAGPELDALKASLRDQYMTVFGKLMIMLVLMVGSGAIGLVVLLVQLITLARNPAKPVDSVGLDLPWKSIYAVFIGWFTSYLLIGLGFHHFMSMVPGVNTQPFLVGLSTALTYLLSNLPTIPLIYYIAFKPRGLSFWPALNFRLRTTTAGPAKLMLFGYFGWCTAIPIIAGAAWIAQTFMHVQGSDNPVIGQIVQAAGSPDILATMIFYFTLGVMAPFFEEIMFRGFLYSAFKTKIGTVGAMVASSALFACMHFDKGGMLMLFAIGMVLAVIYEKTRSIVPCMIAHGLWNSGTFTLALILFSA